jgi:peptidase E
VDRATVTKAAYVGASNADNPDYFTLFTAAMDKINVHQSRMILSEFTIEDKEFLQEADLILLAGGDFVYGWEIIKSKGMDKIIVDKYYSGAVVVGVSAGAMHLGMGGFDQHCKTVIDTLKLVPYYIVSHDEANQWEELKNIISQKEAYAKGFGISSGGGMIFYLDSTIEPLANPLTEIEKSSKSKVISTNILLPPDYSVDEKPYI